MPAIKDAIVEMLEADAAVASWATGGIYVHRAPPMNQDESSRRRDRYVVVRVTDSIPEHTQDAPSQITTDRIEASVWASSSRDAAEGENLVRKALDGATAEAAGISVQRIFWLGTVDREVEDASAAEQLIDGSILEFDVAYTVVVPAESPPGSVITPATLTFRATKDTHIGGDISPIDANYGTTTSLILGRESAVQLPGYAPNRVLLHFDLSAPSTEGTTIPDGATFTLATLALHQFDNIGTPACRLYRLTQTGWTELGVNWAKYDGVNNWTASGAFSDVDLTVPTPIDFTVLAADGFLNIDVLTHTQDAFVSRSKQLHMLLKLISDLTANIEGGDYHSDEFNTTPSFRPLLTVSYE